jgi:hypothetical protein
MRDITYCSHLDCYYKDCTRHQANAPADSSISIADLDDGYCFIPEADIANGDREKLMAAICRGVQKTTYKCANPTRAMCSVSGDCHYCATIADAIEEAFK